MSFQQAIFLPFNYRRGYVKPSGKKAVAGALAYSYIKANPFATGQNQLTVQTVLQFSTFLRVALSRNHSVNLVDQFGTKRESSGLSHLDICSVPFP